MEPVTGIIDQAAEFGAAIFISVMVMVGLGYLIWILLQQAKDREEKADVREDALHNVVHNNTLAIAALAPVLEKMCGDLQAHDARTSTAVNEIAQITPLIRKIDTRTEDMHRLLVGREDRSK